MKPELPPCEEAKFVPRCLVALVAAVCRFPRTVLGVSFVLAALSVWGAATRLQYHTSRNDLISPKKEFQQRWHKYLAEFGDDDDIVAVVKGKDRARMRAALEEIAAQARDRPALFDRLFYKVDLRGIRNRGLLFLPFEEIASIQGNLRGMGPLLEPMFGLNTVVPGDAGQQAERIPITWTMLSLQMLLMEAQNRVAKRAPDAPLSAADEQFFTQVLAVTRTARDTLADPAAYRNPWGSLMPRPAPQRDLLAEPTYFFNEDPQADPRRRDPNEEVLAFLLVRPIKEEGSFTAALASVNGMRAILDGVRGAYPELEFGLTGPPVLESDEMAAAEHDTGLASWLAIAGVTLLFLCVYRGLCYPALTVVTLLTGTAWALGWLTLTVGHLNILSAAFAVMLIGMGDYGVLWVMRYEQTRREGLSVHAALLHTTTHVAVGNLTAASTLALAFFAAIFADFKAVAELGWIAGCGVLLCAFACFTVLPALVVLFDRRTFDADGPTLPFTPPAARAWLPVLTRRPALVVGTGLVATALLGAYALRVQYDHNLLHLQAQDLDAVKWEMILIDRTAGASWHAVSYTDTPQEALALKARYEKLPEVSRVVEAATLVPAEQDKKLPLVRDMQKRLANLPPRGLRIPHDRRSTANLRQALATLIRDIPAHAPAAVLLADLRQALTELETQLNRAPSPEIAEERLRQFDERLAGDLAEDLHRLREVCTPEPITVADLPQGLRERYVGRSGKWLLRVFAKDCLWDFEPLEHFTRQIRTIDPEATGRPYRTVEGLKAMKNGLERAGLFALLVIAAVLFLDFRSPRHTLIALTPLALGVLLTLGVMGLFGVPLNPANMIAFPLILGVGVDNGVHVLHDFLMRRGDRGSPVSYAIGRGVLVKALTTMIGFGTLMISSERGLAGLGLILTLGVGFSMVASLFFLPAMLGLLSGREAQAQPELQEEEMPLRVAA
jgi:hopanoid biosynthesis associated RND transporter like protein HpnN